MTAGSATTHTARTTAGLTAVGPARPGGHGTRSPGEALVGTLVDAAVAPLTALDRPIRGVIVGPAGSGKSAALRLVRDELRARGIQTTAALAAPPATSAAAARPVVLIDDAHLLPDAEIDALAAYAADPDASLVVAHRPNGTAALLRLSARLEDGVPPILLGEVTAEQIGEATRIPLHCAQALVRQTGSLTWLTAAAVDAHDAGTCDVDPAHRDLTRGLRGIIAHRLDHFDISTRAAIEMLCLFDPAGLAGAQPEAGTWDDTISAGRAAGLLGPNGTPPPAVRAAVRAVIPAHRLVALVAAAGAETTASDDEDWSDADWTDHATAPAAGTRTARLIARADAARTDDPARALALYREALIAGAEPRDLGIRYGIASLSTGDLDSAAACFDRMLHSADDDEAADAAAAAIAVWAARGALAAGATGLAGADADADADADAAGGMPSSVSPVAYSRMALAAVGAGTAPPPVPAFPPGVNDTLMVASEALGTALAASLGDDVVAAVDGLLLASELYSATHSDFPLVEPPAVVAAAAALAIGALPVAAAVLDAAVHAQQCGPWARPRLRLWQAWIAIHAARPDEARAHLDRALDCGVALQPRDRLILAACEVALARRYAHTAEVQTVFREASRHLLRRRFDTFLHPFLGELMLASVRVGSPEAVDRHYAAALGDLERLGSPPLWAPPLRWSGVQRGIMRGRPDELAPHARALLAAAAHSPFAAQLAVAGRTWTDVLAGRVDAAVVESAAQALAQQGLAWDGARLAAHGAARTDDRHAAAQLLACARDLHPKQVLGSEPATAPVPIATPDGSALSTRELEVARLVVRGKTYVEIGQTLFISPRTAEHHIARIRRRLDASSRSDLLTKLRDLLDTTADAEVVA